MTKLLYQGHASYRITTNAGKIIYIDPYMGTGYDKEADLRNKYGRMEGTLNSLEGQQSTISNFSKQQSRN